MADKLMVDGLLALEQSISVAVLSSVVKLNPCIQHAAPLQYQSMVQPTATEWLTLVSMRQSCFENRLTHVTYL